jgi:hypothetical protein
LAFESASEGLKGDKSVANRISPVADLATNTDGPSSSHQLFSGINSKAGRPVRWILSSLRAFSPYS